MLISAVFHEDVPGALLHCLPVNLEPNTHHPTPITYRYVRCIVRSFDDTTITADTADGEILVDYANTEGGRDFAYLKKILREGIQLNLLDCHPSSSPKVSQPSTLNSQLSTLNSQPPPLTPHLIIVEPDFMLDISSLAACFTAYGHHPLLYTVSRLKPRPNTQATLLGNFAGTALDDIVHNPDVTLQQSLQRSYREQADRIAACDDFDQEKFEQMAAVQMQNIREAVKILTPHLKSLNSQPLTLNSYPLLEPSFVCERLGLQGRVDLMTSDMSLLVEQKSGKNQKIEYQSHDSHGLQLESHYVQLLLYYGILRYNFGKSDMQVDTRLLYSRYAPDKGLLTVNYYRTLFREAIKLRNQIVATELLIARDGFGRIMPLLNADIIYKGIARDGFFHHYVLPEISRLTSLFSLLTPLERAYYERMMTFVYREQRAQKLGSSEQTLHHAGGCSSDLWLMPLNEKQEQGNIIMPLTIKGQEKTDPDGGYNLITLSLPSPTTTHPTPEVSPLGPTGRLPKQELSTIVSQPSTLNSQPLPFNFRPGDMVYLYRYEGEPDVRKSILYKGTLQDIRNGEVTILLNDGQQNPDIFQPSPLTSHPSPLTSQLKSLNSQLKSLTSQPSTLNLWAVEHGGSDVGINSNIRSLHQFIQATPRKKTLLLGQRPPEADTTLTLSRAYNPHYDDIILKAKQARDYFLLVGPPGTGKTSMALRFIIEEELKAAVPDGLAAVPDGFPSGHILLMAYTNRAVDEIRAMLSKAGLDDDDRLVVGTTSMMLARPFLLAGRHFSLAIVDEASQVLEPGLIGLLSSEEIDRFLLIGDHKQLPAVVQQNPGEARVDDPLLRAIGLTDCRQSLFQRLYNWERTQGRTQFIGTLSHQGRMHPDVAQFAGQHFYGSWLTTVPLPHQLETSLNYTLPAQDALDDILKTRRVAFFDSPKVSQLSTLNSQPQPLTVTLAQRIRRFYGDRFDPQSTLGIIVTYRKQIAAIREAVPDVTIDTVERYQGSQRNVIIYDFGISRLYQLDFLTASTFTDDEGQTVDRKLNVAMTRARQQLLLVGNARMLAHNPLLRQLIENFSVKL